MKMGQYSMCMSNLDLYYSKNVMDKTNEFLSKELIRSLFVCLSKLNRQILMQPKILQYTSDWLSAESVLQPAQLEPVESKIGEKAEIKISTLLEQKH